MKLDILAIGAHPDDVELGVGGTLLKLFSEGKKIGIIDLTQGELGTRGTKETRKKEAEKAAKLLGVSIRENLKFRDGFFINDETHQLAIIQKIRQYQPSIIFANPLNDRHPDHGKAAQLVSEACFLSGLPKIITQFEGKKQEAWRPKHLFHYIQWIEVKPDFVIDITGFEHKKMEACLAYTTQFFTEKSTEPETPITSKNFKESILYRSKNLGRLVGVEYAEGFQSQNLLGLNNFENFI